MAIFGTAVISEIDFTSNMNGTKVLKFPHCENKGCGLFKDQVIQMKNVLIFKVQKSQHES